MSSSPSSSPSSGMGFPVVAIAIVGILSTAGFLLGYYIFVIKCCLNLQRSDSNEHILRRFSRSRRFLHRHFSPASAEHRGLHPSSIRAIPIFRYSATTAFIANECAVCLLEFRDEERLRLLPGCSHAFHIDCIDTWLASNANCPLCRAEITHTMPTTACSMVIEVGEVAPAAAEKKAGKWRGLAGSLGDECVEVRRVKEEVFAVQPMRRSLSMDSSGDRPLYIAVQEAVRRNPDLSFREVESGRRDGGGGGGGGSGRRPFFSFRRSRSSMRAVLPVELDV